MEITRYLFSLPGTTDGLYLLSEHVSQDPLENYFGQQRGRGGRSDNPSVEECLKNSASIKQQGSLSQVPVRGNSSRRQRLFPEEKIYDTPLPKRCRKSRESP